MVEVQIAFVKQEVLSGGRAALNWALAQRQRPSRVLHHIADVLLTYMFCVLSIEELDIPMSH